MKWKQSLSLIFFIYFFNNVLSQGVGVGITIPTAKLHLHESDFFGGIGANLRLSNANSGSTTNDGLFVYYQLGKAGINLMENHLFSLATNNIDRLHITGNGQIGIGTSSPHPSALLQLESNNQGFLLPRMTSNERLNVAGTNGLMVYDTILKDIFVFKDGFWSRLSGPIWNKDVNNNINYMGGNVAIGDTPSMEDVLRVTTNELQSNNIYLTNNYNGSQTKSGVVIDVRSEGSGDRFGIFSRATASEIGSAAAVGVFGEARNNASTGGQYGVYGLAVGADGNEETEELNYGVYGEVNGKGYGIYGEGEGANSAAGFFKGNVVVDGVENIGSQSAFRIINVQDTMSLDGNEIDALNNALRLNANSNRNISLASGGGAVSIGTDNIAGSEKLRINGKTVSSELRLLDHIGNGERNVLTDADGNLKPDNRTFICNIPPYEFSSSNSSFFINEANGAGIREDFPPFEGFFWAPIKLPHNSVIRKVTFYYRDYERVISDDYEIEIKLVESLFDTSEQSALISFTSSGGDDNIRSITYNNLSIPIDNATNYYWIKVEEIDPFGIKTWDGNTIKGVVIEYTMH